MIGEKREKEGCDEGENKEKRKHLTAEGGFKTPHGLNTIKECRKHSLEQKEV